MGAISLKNICKSFGSVDVIKDELKGLVELDVLKTLCEIDQIEFQLVVDLTMVVSLIFRIIDGFAIHQFSHQRIGRILTIRPDHHFYQVGSGCCQFNRNHACSICEEERCFIPQCRHGQGIGFLRQFHFEPSVEIG